jgi:outer membrane protein
MTTRRNLIVLLTTAVGVSVAFAAGALRLPDAIRQLPNSLEWQNAELTYQTAQRSLDSARAAAGLKVNVGTDASASFPVTTPNNGSSGTVSVNANASLSVLPWSSAYDGVRTAERALYRAALDRADTRNTLALNTAQNYFNARVGALDLENAKRAESLAAQQLTVAERQAQAGQVSKDSLETTRKNLENAKLTTLQAQQNADLTRLQLFQALSLPISADTLETAPQQRALPTGTLEALLAQALQRRADVQKAVSRVGDAEDSLRVAERDRWLPNATVTTSVGQGQGGSSVSGSLNVGQGTLTVSGSTPVTGTNTQPTSVTLGASLSIPLVNASADAKISSAQTSLESARKSLEATRQSASLDVRQKFNDATLQTRKLEYQKKVLENAQSALETAKKRFELGSITALEVTSAQNTVFQAGRDLEAQTATQQLSVYKLENAIGTLEILQGGNS